jgi:deoxyribonuclease I
MLFVFFSLTALAAPPTFNPAKIEARQYIYHDRSHVGTFYCGCNWKWVGRSGGRVDLDSCGYEIRSQVNRAIRTEWEHVVPAANFGRARQCWQNGGRKNCNATDPVFNAMEADLQNLTPAIGEINADRSNYRFGVLPNDPQHGACDFKVDFKGRVAEPRNEIKGQIARIYFYMHDQYDLPMSRQQQQLLMAWDKQYPVTDWERERDRRIATRMGHNNPFVTGTRTWALDPDFHFPVSAVTNQLLIFRSRKLG